MASGRFEVDMSQGPLLKKITTYVLPLMLTGILQLLYNAADIVVVGRYTGSTALAAVGSTIPLINLLVNMFIGLSVGVSVAIAQHYGAREYTDVQETVHTALLISLIVGIFVGALGATCARIVLVWMGSPADVIEQATLYLRIFFLGIPAAMFYNFGAAILRAVGNTRQPLYYLSAAGVINVILNLVLVIRFKMGVAGVAIPTVISQYISAILILICLMRTEGCLQFTPRHMRIVPQKLAAIARIGVPAGLQSALFCFSNVIIQSVINSFGSAAMAGAAAASNLASFMYTCLTSVGQAALTVTGQNVGAGQYQRINRITGICLGLIMAVSVVLSTAFYVFADALLAIYAPGDPVVIAYGRTVLLMHVYTYFLMGILEVLAGSMRGMGDSLTPMLVSIFGICGLRILWVYTVFQANPTWLNLYLSYPASWLITAALQAVCYFIVRRRLLRRAALL
ncbi:MAG: MATE family efflux transporter [Christensenellaceae bacterium]|jgi:putative MATE family efflux protein|nr:MATE family efflux transporter [Christensenellaceae bacterium]